MKDVESVFKVLFLFIIFILLVWCYQVGITFNPAAIRGILALLGL